MAPGEQFLLSTIFFYLMLSFCVRFDWLDGWLVN